MAATGSLVPAQIDMHGVVGGDFAASINLYQDVAQTTPFDLTGYTISIVIGNGLLTLTPGSGLTITAAAGLISIVITAAQTLTIPNAQAYFLKLIDAGSLISFPVHGSLTLLTP